MSKFSSDEKLQAVMLYQNGSESLKTIANSIGLHHSDWIRQFKYHSEDAFKKGYTSYSAQDKLDVLNHMNKHGTSVRETAAVFNIASHSTILSWQKKHRITWNRRPRTKEKGAPIHERRSKRTEESNVSRRVCRGLTS